MCMQMGLHKDLSEWTEERDHFLEPFSGCGGKDGWRWNCFCPQLSQSSHGLLPPSVISNSYRPVGLLGFFLWPPWWLPGTASEKYAVNVDRDRLTANICWVKHLRSVAEIDFRGTLSTSVAFFHPSETSLWEFSLHWLSSPLIVALHRGVFKKQAKRERGELIDSSNQTFLRNMDDSCDLDLVFSMPNRFLRNSGCLPQRVLSLLMRLGCTICLQRAHCCHSSLNKVRIIPCFSGQSMFYRVLSLLLSKWSDFISTSTLCGRHYDFYQLHFAKEEIKHKGLFQGYTATKLMCWYSSPLHASGFEL